MAAAKTRSGQRKNLGLIFCEDANDAVALGNLARAINPKLPSIEYCRKPIILVRDAKDAEARKKNASNVASVVRAKSVIANVKLVIAHQDCDALEPAHVDVTKKIETALKSEGLINVIPVAPAWEIEAWWFLWPKAVAAVNKNWRPLKRAGNHGLIQDAKEALRRDLRNSLKTRDYEESDSRAISAAVLAHNLVGITQGTSDSFSDYKNRVSAIS